MPPPSIPEQSETLITSFRAVYKTLQDEDWGHLGGRELPFQHRVADLGPGLMQPAVWALEPIAAQSEGWFQSLTLSQLKRLHEACVHLDKGRAALKNYVASAPDDSTGPPARAATSEHVMKAVRLAEEKAEAVLMRLEISRLERKTQEPVQIMTELRDLHRLVKQDAQATAKTRAEVDQTVAVVKKAAADHSVVLEAAHFSSAATNHGLAALVSLGVTFVLAGGLLCWVLHVIAHADAYQPPRADLGWSVAANLSHFGIRLLGVSVVSFLLVVSVRSFRASRHNQITNAHRAGALRTFRELREAASGPVADAILLQATDAIFRPQPTGFGDESVGAPNHVAELMKMFRQETSKSSNAE